MKKLCLFLPLILSSCTISVNLIHTNGSASDVIDSAQTTAPEVSAEANIPASII